jgi:hypothetical protein
MIAQAPPGAGAVRRAERPRLETGVNLREGDDDAHLILAAARRLDPRERGARAPPIRRRAATGLSHRIDGPNPPSTLRTVPLM